MYNHKPFDGDGYSLYANTGTTVKYRNRRLLCGDPLGSAELAFGATNVEKTARRDTVEPGDTWTIPSSFQSQTVSFDLRRYKDDVENETYNYRTVTMAIDGSGDGTTAINGTATLISKEVQAGGIVVIRIRYFKTDNGVQPNLFSLVRTAGPTAPGNIEVIQPIVQPATLITFTTGALNESSAYTFKVTASNDATTKDVLTGISITAATSGPAAATTATAEEW